MTDLSHIDDIRLIDMKIRWERCKCDRCKKEVAKLQEELERRHKPKDPRFSNEME